MAAAAENEADLISAELHFYGDERLLSHSFLLIHFYKPICASYSFTKKLNLA